MSQKYAMYGAVALALILVIVAVVAYFSTGDSTVAGGAGAAAAAAAAEAMRRRNQTKTEVEDAKTDVKVTAEKVAAIRDGAQEDMNAEADKVGNESDDEKVADGNDLFG
jgi:hypothetical protein